MHETHHGNEVQVGLVSLWKFRVYTIHGSIYNTKVVNVVNILTTEDTKSMHKYYTDRLKQMYNMH
jgi:hypothetical protein